MSTPLPKDTYIQIRNYTFPFELFAASQKSNFLPSPAIRLNIDFQHIHHQYLPMNLDRWNRHLTEAERQDIRRRFASTYSQWVDALRTLPGPDKLQAVHIYLDTYLTYTITYEKVYEFVRDITSVLWERLGKAAGA
jgi:hypothetical protein